MYVFQPVDKKNWHTSRVIMKLQDNNSNRTGFTPIEITLIEQFFMMSTKRGLIGILIQFGTECKKTEKKYFNFEHS